jgi:hypothetical protein
MSIRILFSMVADGNLPFAAAHRERLGDSARVPVVRRSLSGSIALLILAFNIVNPSAFTIIISLGIILMYVAYLGVTIPLLRMRLNGWPGNLPDAQRGAVRARPLGRGRERCRDPYGASMIYNLDVAARRALRRRHLQVGSDRRDVVPRRLRADLLLQPSSGTRAGCSRSTAPRVVAGD